MYGSGKKIVYRYKGRFDVRDVELDPDDKIPMPIVGSTIVRNGKEWTVISVLRQLDISDPNPLPVIFVVLSDGSED
jgi:hypothetical protein